MSEKKKLIINLIKSFFVSFAWMNIGGLESTSILLLCVFFASMLILSNEDTFVAEVKKNERVSSILLGALFVVLYALYADLTGGLSSKLFIAVFVAGTVIGLWVMFSHLLLIIFNNASRLMCKKKDLKRNDFSIKIWLEYSLIVFLGCLVFLALNYPGVMTTDSLNQYSQVIGTEPYMNHHPWLHTALIELFYNIGYFFTKDVYAAIACYTVFQAVVVSLSIGYAIECLYEMGLEKKFRIILLLCFVLLPYNLIYAVTIWKDILFTMAVLVLTMTIIRVGIRDSLRDRILFIVSGFATCVLRHNGYYAFIVTAVIWLLIERKKLKRYIVYSLGIIVLAALCRGPIMEACGVAKGEYVYNMCMPLQQIGRVVAEGGDISKEEEEWLQNINSFDYIEAGYSTQWADPMFAWVLDGNEEFFNAHKLEFLKIWISVGLKNPMVYINEFIDLTMGYWAPMAPLQTVYFGITPNNSMGLFEKPIISGPVLIKINELITKIYTMIPIYGFMYCMGGFFWIMLVLGCICINCKQYKKLYSFLLVFLLTCTLFIATPLVADMRYAYALLVVLPYLFAYTFTNTE